ncbi:MAG TPA: hypothetical protein VLW55_00540 [Burkholderiaceae bacterium]|nr:hypothetical protein [Burkholderiaceae bacterium]
MGSRLIAFVLGAASCASALAGAPGISLAEYLATKRQLSTELQAAKVACGAETSSRREICMADATGRDWVAKADLEVAYRSNARSRADARLARVDASFWLARERCDELAQQDGLVCMQQAKTVRLAAGTAVAAQRNAEELDELCASAVAAGDRTGSRTCRPGAAEARTRAARSTPQ